MRDYEPGELITTIETKKGLLSVVAYSLEGAEKLREIMNYAVKHDYIANKYCFPTVKDAEKFIKKRRDKMKKGEIIQVFGKINGEFILTASMNFGNVKGKKNKGKKFAEIGMTIDKKYRSSGIGGKMLDFFIEKGKEMNLLYLCGRFYHENFQSLVLCKSRKLDVYRIDKNKAPFRNWSDDYKKNEKYYDRVNARIYL